MCQITSNLALWKEVLGLALADLRSEFLLTACMVAALIAIIIPLLILAGLRAGIVDSLRNNLVHDPVFREIRPAETRPYSEIFFAELRAMPSVEFVMEGITRGASTVVAIRPDNNRSVMLDILPTAPNDPLLTTYGAVPPIEGEAVISASAALKLGAEKDDVIVLEIGRQRNGSREVQREFVRVTKVMPERADALPRIYLPFALVKDIEMYREGFGISERNWPGASPDVVPGYNGVYILSAEPLNAILRSQLLNITGFFEGGDAVAEEYERHTGQSLTSEQSVFRLSTIDHLAEPAMLERVRGLLFGKAATLQPYVENLSVKLLHEGIASSVLFPVVCQPGSQIDSNEDFTSLLSVQVPRSLAEWYQQGSVDLHFTTPMSNLTIPLHVTGVASRDELIVPAALAAMLQRGVERKIFFDTISGRLVAGRSSYRGFRLYTGTIDEVPSIVRFLKQRGIDVVAQVGTIERIQTLDKGLMKLFLLIACIGSIGAAIVLLINLYAAVERKVNQFGHLRLLGLTRNEVFLYPVYQGMVIAIAATIFASLGSGLISIILNHALTGDLGFNGSICHIRMRMFCLTSGITIILALFASLLAAIRVTRIDPADAIRVE